MVYRIFNIYHSKNLTTMYSGIVKRAFMMLNTQNSYVGMDNGIRKILNTLESIDEGTYIKNIENGLPNVDIEDWLLKHKSEGFLGRGHGILLPIDKDKRLFLLLKIFRKIGQGSFEAFIKEFYREDLLSMCADLFLHLSGVYMGLNGKNDLNFKMMEHDREKEVNNVKRFNEDISSDFERLLLDDIELKYPRNKTKIIMGDNFENVFNSTIVNRSVFFDVMKNEDDDKSLLLVKMKRIVEESQNEDAIGLFNDLLEELSKKEPRKRRLRSFWNGIVELLPHIKNITDIASNIDKLIGG